MVLGVTKRWHLSARGGRRMSAANTACPLQAGSGVGAAEYGDLVSQYEELDVLGGGRAAHQQEQPERVLEDHVQQPQRHGEDHAGELASINRCWSAACAAF